MRISEIIDAIEQLAPTAYQESYDNSGLICGDRDLTATGALLSLDCTEEVIAEAIETGCNLVISHHPILFSAIKRLTPSSHVERTLITAIRNNIAIYACHTNLDNVRTGVNKHICDKLGVQNQRILVPQKGTLKKIVTFVPETHLDVVRQAMFSAGAGHIGNYDSCSFSHEGEGTFRGNDQAKPFIGAPGQLSHQKEKRLEVVTDHARINPVIRALHVAHPYEEVAYDVYALENAHPSVGSGMLGDLAAETGEKDFLALIKNALGCKMIRHTALTGKKIKKVAVCGGSGRFLLKNAISAGADVFVTADFKYHEFFEVEGRLLLVDAGHYETEHLVPEIFYGFLKEKFSTFAVRLSKINTNPVNYF